MSPQPEITELPAEPADHDLDALVGLINAKRRELGPWLPPETRLKRAAHLAYGWDGEPSRYFLARVDGRAAGFAELSTSDYDNTDLVWVRLFVADGHRHDGVGKALAERMLDEARATGRHVLGADGPDVDGTREFAARYGFELKHTDAVRVQTLADVPAATIDDAYDEAAEKSGDYELVRVIGPVPDDLAELVVGVAAAMNDAPMGDLTYEDEVFSVERLRAYEAGQQAGGQKIYRLLARHRGTGELGGHTVVVIDGEFPTYGRQHDTAVARDHRGHRLGLLLKAGMVRWLRDAEPQVETIDTGNAANNRWMIAVNERLGYRLVGQELEFEQRI